MEHVPQMQGRLVLAGDDGLSEAVAEELLVHGKVGRIHEVPDEEERERVCILPGNLAIRTRGDEVV